jgi:glutathione S-transferase
MLKIWGRTTSSNVMKVLWACAELGVSYERVDLGGPFGGNDDPAYRAMNPNGVVPTIEDDGLVLWESNVIVRYLGRKHGLGSLVPSDARTCADADRWMDWQQTTLNPPFGPIFLGMVRTPPEQRDMAAINASVAKVQGLLGILDRRLADRPYVAGDRLTMGDIPFGPNVHRWLHMPIPRQPLPNVEAWYQRVNKRAGFATNIAAIPIS